MNKNILSVAVLELGPLPPELVEERGNYGRLYREWLQRNCVEDGIIVETTSFFVQEGSFPPKEEKEEEDFDLFILSGSGSSVNDGTTWIKETQQYILWLDRMKKKVLGVCFGHQLLSTAFGGRVEQNPKGWELSLNPFSLTEEGKDFFSFHDVPVPSSLSLQQSHRDHVHTLPECFDLLGGNEKSFCHFYRKEQHILSCQGHPEFDGRISEFLLKKKRNLGMISEEVEKIGIEKAYLSDDSQLLASLLFSWLSYKNENP